MPCRKARYSTGEGKQVRAGGPPIKGLDPVRAYHDTAAVLHELSGGVGLSDQQHKDLLRLCYAVALPRFRAQEAIDSTPEGREASWQRARAKLPDHLIALAEGRE